MNGIEKQAFQLLKQIVKNTTEKKTDNEITQGEVRRFFDTNKDDFASDPEINKEMDILRYAANTLELSTVKNPNKRAQLEQAQKLLRQLLNTKTFVKQAPPNPIANTPLANAPLIINPHELADANAMENWTAMRTSFQGKTIDINVTSERQSINNILNAHGGNVSELVKELWQNGDSVNGMRTQVVRMNELIGAWAYSKTDPDFKDSFIKEMANYINTSGLDKQFVLDSLLQVIQSTDFTGQEDLQGFLKDLALGIANNVDAFKNKDGVIGNYDGTRDGSIYGSLALVREGGKLKFIEHDPSIRANKTRYLLTEGVVGRGGIGPGAPPAVTPRPAVPAAGPAAPDDDAAVAPRPADIKNGGVAPGKPGEDELKNLGKALLEEIKNIKDKDARKELKRLAKNLNGVDIPNLIATNDTAGLKNAISSLESLAKKAQSLGQTALAEKVDSLIKILKDKLEEQQSQQVTFPKSNTQY